MSRIIESYNAARKRVNPDGLIVGTAIAGLSNLAIIPLEGIITGAIREAETISDPNLLKIAAVGLIGIANAVSVGLETKALQEKKYSATPIASTLNIITGMPLASSVGEHTFTYAIISTLNPINAVAIYNNDNQLLLESLGATSLAYPFWLSLMNSLILKNKIDPLVNNTRNIRQSILKKIKRH